jgi:transposase InsO family protein
MATEDDIWADAAIDPVDDRFCETCRLTTARKANKGNSPLEELEDLIPGSFVMVDIVTNPTSFSVAAATFFPYDLAVTDVASRLFVPLGLKAKTAESVMEALQDWATSYGSNTEFNMSMITRIHGEFDSTFTSTVLRDAARRYNIRISFARPRSQYQNGIQKKQLEERKELGICHNEPVQNAHEILPLCA